MTASLGHAKDTRPGKNAAKVQTVAAAWSSGDKVSRCFPSPWDTALVASPHATMLLTFDEFQLKILG